jgi:hypothetical protein
MALLPCLPVRPCVLLDWGSAAAAASCLLVEAAPGLRLLLAPVTAPWVTPFSLVAADFKCGRRWTSSIRRSPSLPLSG